MALGIGIREGFRTITRNSSLFFLSLLVAAISLFLLSIFALVTVNLYTLVRNLDEKIEIIAFLDDHADAMNLKASIQKINGVKEVIFVSSQQALTDLQREMKSSREVLNVFEDNPLPASLRIKLQPSLRNGRGLAEISDKVMLLKGVRETIFGGELVDQLKRITNIITIFDLVLLVIIILSVVFVIFQTIKLTIFARAPEIEVMRLVGASDSFIAVPFTFQGLIQGLIGGVIAFVLTMITVRIGSSFFNQLYFPRMWFFVANVLAGVVLGMIGSGIALRKFLK
jgi:cell division transport system permease protein